MAADFTRASDSEFNRAFCRDYCKAVVHRFHVGGGIWHVCTFDTNNYYAHGFYRWDEDRAMFVAYSPTDEDGMKHGFNVP